MGSGGQLGLYSEYFPEEEMGGEGVEMGFGKHTTKLQRRERGSAEVTRILQRLKV